MLTVLHVENLLTLTVNLKQSSLKIYINRINKTYHRNHRNPPSQVLDVAADEFATPQWLSSAPPGAVRITAGWSVGRFDLIGVFLQKPDLEETYRFYIFFGMDGWYIMLMSFSNMFFRPIFWLVDVGWMDLCFLILVVLYCDFELWKL